MKNKNVKTLLKIATVCRNFNVLLCAAVAIVLLVMVLAGASMETFTDAILITLPVWLLQVIYEAACLIFDAIWRATKK